MISESNNLIERKSIFLILFSQAIGLVAAFVLAIMGFVSGLGSVALIIGLLIVVASVVYPLVKLTQMSSEINIMCEDDGEHLMPYICAWLLGCITLGIYYIYYLYRMQTRLHENAYRYNVTISERGGSVILWFLLLLIFFGIGPIISLAIIIKSFNKMAYGYNKTITNSESSNMTGILKCVQGDIEGAEIVMDNANDTVIIGRDPSMANIVSSDKKISKQHCIVRFDSNNKCFYVTDCKSTNGTKLDNGSKLIGGVETKISGSERIMLSENTVFTLDIME